ncbi:MAG: DUF3153 domain-containing protein [Synechococcus sp.]
MSLPTAAAEAALERGDYGVCLELLEPLAKEWPITDPEGARIRMLMVTAWMGQGQDAKAVSTCRLLTRCRDSDLRLRAKQLLDVLEAPSLQRPANWSMQLPTLDMTPQVGRERPRPMRRRRSQGPPPPPPPPTGPTQAAAPGFAVVVITVLVGLTLLLGSCGRLNADINLIGPDRVQLGWSSDSGTGRLLPWQTTFAQNLKRDGSAWSLSHGHEPTGVQRFHAPVMRAAAAEQLLGTTITTAGAAAGLMLPSPVLQLNERNWLVGVQQQLELVVDLEELADLPLPELSVSVTPLPRANSATSSPLTAAIDHGRLVWPLQAGRRNQLSMRSWHWNPLGIGTVVVGLLLGVTLLLQQVRLKLGFGYPELPS